MSFTTTAQAAPCADYESGRSIYGSGGSAVTGTLRRVAQGLKGLPEDEQITVFYHDKLAACGGYGQLQNPAATAATLTYWTWAADGTATECEAPATKVTFAHMGNTPTMCPGNEPLPAGYRSYISAVQTTNVITDITSTQTSISAEALYYVLGFGPGASGKAVAPWVTPGGLFGRSTSSFVHQLLAAAVKVPPTLTQILAANTRPTNDEVALGVAGELPGNAWTGGEASLGYVSGSAAEARREKVKTLAYQHFDQSCGYLPDSDNNSFDKVNVRAGQYYLWTPGWLYAKVNASGVPVAQDGETPVPGLEDFIAWFSGAEDSPEISVAWNGGPWTSVTEVIIKAGDIPLCAMHAIRPGGNLTAIQSYQPDKPCNGYFELIANGTTDYQQCSGDGECTGENEKCFYGYCEVTYPDSTN
ncbi:MAG TPA: hypothetical protein VLC09_01370 [Polyangiaceae bacterium]|nr:hypothetical protein [Polyangiaceae bacterium]